MAVKQFTKAYAANMSSLNGLETTCEADEGNLTAKIISLELATDTIGNVTSKVTAGKYERDRVTPLGNLAFEEYKTEVDVTSLKAIHATKGDTFLFKGEAYVNNNSAKVLVFREK
jgi:hypothetical protein